MLSCRLCLEIINSREKRLRFRGWLSCVTVLNSLEMNYMAIQLAQVAQGSEPAAEEPLSHSAAQSARKLPSLLAQGRLIWKSLVESGLVADTCLATLPVHPDARSVTVDHLIVRRVLHARRTPPLGRGASMRQ
jgi:hypothetical protein